MITVTAAVLFHQDKILIAKRRASDKQCSLWEFPGGKLEKGETPEECLRRELREELGIQTQIGKFYTSSIYEYEHGGIELLAFLATWISGEIKVNAHDEIKWVNVCELHHYNFAPADIPIVEKLSVELEQ